MATRFRQINGVAPDLRNPRLLSERILHRILTDRDPLLRTFCDKVRAKDWIATRIGAGRTPRTLAITESVEALRDHPLPDRWMLKASHGSGWYQLVSATTHPLDQTVMEQARRWLSMDYADIFHEWGYRRLPRRLLAEEFLSCAGRQCIEMSAFCFLGNVRGLRLFRPESAHAVHRSNQPHLPRTKECFLDEALQPLPLERPQHDHCPDFATLDRLPLETFCGLARRLSSETPFLRVDGYLSDKGVLVGELTPYPGAGLLLRMPRQWDAWFGAFWT
ncbi:ATP-grasp fold amidoligase family protein [Cyanobium gracile UHCC 0139]|uniref:ATP-grasp fold amidoligase family protein n=1 Tax=Cyanobium gracile UHCC 0139 TaxID=3110308 RepID=A0ABU5RUH3_9CYAN|nr:ATP-grasp fold amidoligase family protein [Cyanobium gracile]MEA5391401.1 ATP-grasp fold amidoligase family protein [Cyanobium gracile UHCC 0139]